MNLRNWAGNLEYAAERLHRPGSVEELQEIVRHSRRVKALGTRHSFSDIADTDGDLVSMENLNRIVQLDWQNSTVTIEGGMRYGELCRYLNTEGYALHNLASLPHISVAGACATATHGSGDQNGCLATAISRMEVVGPSGEIQAYAHGEASFEGVVVNLGGLGVVARLTLDLQPEFSLRQNVYENLPFDELEAHFDGIMSSDYSVSLFTDWQGESINQAWVKGFYPGGQTFFGATVATEKLHPIKAIAPVNCTDQMGIEGPWHERLPHFRLEYVPSAGEELQSEFLVPRRHAVEAITAVRALRDQIRSVLQISEIRTVAADDFWMSPFYFRDCVAIHFTWKRDWENVQLALALIEGVLEPFDARPHWGKLFLKTPTSERADDFRRLLDAHDPEGKFRNAFLSRILGG